MRSQFEERIRAGIADIAGEVLPGSIEPAPSEAVLKRPSWTARRLVPLAAGLTVMALALLTVVLPLAGDADHVATPDSRPRLPVTFAPLSLLTANLSDDPLGQPAIAVIAQGKPGLTGVFTQAVAVGMDGRTYRRIDAAEQRGARTTIENEWANAQALLSPNGRLVAVGAEQGGAAGVPVVDLLTGSRRDIALPAPAAYRLLDWSPDSTKVALIQKAEPRNISGAFDAGGAGFQLSILDLDSGTFTTVPGVDMSMLGPAVFSASGRLLVAESAGKLSVVDPGAPDGPRVVSSFALPPGHLVAWSADEQTVVLADGDDSGSTLRVLNIDNGQFRQSVHLPGRRWASHVTWSGPARLTVFTQGLEDWQDCVLSDVDITTGQVRQLSRFSKGLAGSPTGISLAGDLLAVAEPGSASAERGPWPWWARACLLFTGLAALIIAYRYYLRRRPGASPGLCLF